MGLPTTKFAKISHVNFVQNLKILRQYSQTGLWQLLMSHAFQHVTTNLSHLLCIALFVYLIPTFLIHSLSISPPLSICIDNLISHFFPMPLPLYVFISHSLYFSNLSPSIYYSQSVCILLLESDPPLIFSLPLLCLYLRLSLSLSS